MRCKDGRERNKRSVGMNRNYSRNRRNGKKRHFEKAEKPTGEQLVAHQPIVGDGLKSLRHPKDPSLQIPRGMTGGCDSMSSFFRIVLIFQSSLGPGQYGYSATPGPSVRQSQEHNRGTNSPRMQIGSNHLAPIYPDLRASLPGPDRFQQRHFTPPWPIAPQRHFPNSMQYQLPQVPPPLTQYEYMNTGNMAGQLGPLSGPNPLPMIQTSPYQGQPTPSEAGYGTRRYSSDLERYKTFFTSSR